ncbi:DNA topoisomerase I [Candidatus Pacearchaeota archaeon CG_4_10_14_0_2_um_filter_05_32_18]|nr:MAG: DNA topoisomerase I [Candidatus Pacearchaeota archaeon CG_4_10_14_0_2_um_filter_05_32_18]
MPPKKKTFEDPVKHYGEQSIKQDFVPVGESDLAGAVDVPVKSRENIETIERKGGEKIILKKVKGKRKSKKIIKAKEKNGKSWTDKFKGENKKLKEKGYILVITEKPQAAEKIADALAEGKVIKSSLGNVPYYTFQRRGKDIQVVCAVGHLFTIAQVNARNKWPTFDIQWAPNYLVRKNDFTKRYYDVIAKLHKNASEIIVATDYDIEGEVIGMNIIRYICGQKDAERMKFSTLTSKEIQEAYEKRSKTLDWGQGIAGETRHYLDWLYGINLSRALMDAIKTTGKFRLMSIGRVQGPALHIIVEKEKEIQKFKPEKYWQVFLDINDGKNSVNVKYQKDITNEKELVKFNGLEGKSGVVKTEKSRQEMPPNAPFDLTNLQTESYRLYKITPNKTLEIAQRLYLGGVISYPRTSSQKIPKEIDYESILNRLKKRFNFIEMAKRKIPVEGKKTDPAHPSIYPTGEFHELEEDDKKIYELIVRRFVNCFCENAVIDNKKITFTYDGMNFFARGLGIAKKGWMEVYPILIKESEIPDMDGEATIKKEIIEEKMTQPPRRYSPASIISELEKKNLGTKATRANILETLYQRGYIKEKSITATSLGISLINTLENNSPVIINEKLTRDIEINLESIRNSKNPTKSKEKILEEAKKVILSIGKDFEKNKSKIGQDLVKATESLWEEERKDNEVMSCPECNKGTLSLKYSKEYKRYFLGCSSYPECKKTYSLPPNSLIKKSDKKCEYCNFPMLISIRKGKRPWTFCFNPECESRKNRESEEKE